MILAYLTLLTALAISGVAAYYSIIGLVAIFSASVIPIAVMGVVLETGKLVTAAWLYHYWRRVNVLLKTYLISAVLVLMFITVTNTTMTIMIIIISIITIYIMIIIIMINGNAI